MAIEHLDFSHQNLCDRSFRGQDLQGADFSGSDIRGCDFQGAQLQGASFENARAGRSFRRFGIALLATVIVAVLAMNAISRMVYGAIAANESVFTLVLVLHLTTGLAGLTTAIAAFTSGRSLLRRVLWMLAGALSTALLGFFYVGTWADQDQTAAVIGAVVGAVLGAIVSLRLRNKALIMAITLVGAIASYGFACLVGAWAIALGSGGRTLASLPWGLISLSYLGLTTGLVWRAIQLLMATGRTSFEQANLTEARFSGAKLSNTDFTNAIGYQECETKK